MTTHQGAHEAPARELIPGVTRRAAALVIGVLLLEFGFVLSYVGAFHAPTPREVPLAVVAPIGAPAGTARPSPSSWTPSTAIRSTPASPAPRTTPGSCSRTGRWTGRCCWHRHAGHPPARRC